MGQVQSRLTISPTPTKLAWMMHLRMLTTMHGLCEVRQCSKRWKNLCPQTKNLQKCQMSSAGSSEMLQVTVDDKSGIATMTMCRPPVNSLNLEFLTQINIALEKLENSKDCSGLIITSKIPKIFCAGLDIMEMYQPNVDRLQEFWRTLQEMYIRLYGSQLITAAAINGASPAGGCLMAMSCDYRVMAPGYKIGLNETQLGIVAPFWFQDLIINTMGFRQSEMALQLGTLFTSEEALNLGMVDKIVPQEQVMETAIQEIHKWKKIPGFARQITKSALRKPSIDKLHSKREEDIANFRDFITKDSIQKTLGMYIESLKKKAK
ncbi:hypothetical protein FSP39_016632 [Pinctada imbricata]|uniref:Enoyl-CoA delta isomerase 1, mitochondrial n=1 Tax=Pinctada imbricata TaxID=66713 RepID=A0AA89C1Q1_PINIB|nr:hypothetical protein FSP39_016632 [Pinctada imbricata]